MSTPKRISATATAVVVLILTTIGVATANAEYSGGLEGRPGTQVQLRLDRAGGPGRRSGSFIARAIPFGCDDTEGMFTSSDFPTLRLRFFKKRRFEGHVYRREANGDQSYFKVGGKIGSHGVATGDVFAYIDPFDPPAGPYAADCSLPHTTWTASRATGRSRTGATGERSPERSSLRHVEENRSTPRYTGALVDDADSQISLTLERNLSGTLVSRFRARDVLSRCDDGSSSYVDYDGGPLRLLSQTFFHTDLLQYGKNRLFIWVISGHFSSNRKRVQGKVLFFNDPFDSPENPVPADCSTDGPLAWSARLTNPDTADIPMGPIHGETGQPKAG